MVEHGLIRVTTRPRRGNVEALSIDLTAKGRRIAERLAAIDTTLRTAEEP